MSSEDQSKNGSATWADNAVKKQEEDNRAEPWAGEGTAPTAQGESSEEKGPKEENRDEKETELEGEAAKDSGEAGGAERTPEHEITF